MGFFKFGKTIIGSIFKKPSTLMYPVVPREWQERTRGAVGIDGPACIGCGMCQRACPTEAITVDAPSGAWTIQRMQCIQCSACVDCCPKKCLTMENLYTIPDVVKVVDTYEIPKKEKKAKAAPAGGGAPADDSLTCSDTCVFCGLCVKACPADCIEVDRKAKSWKVNKDECLKCGACIDKCPKGSLSFGAPAAGAEAKPKKPRKKKIAQVDLDKCLFCNRCTNVCPKDALDTLPGEWNLKKEDCIGCGLCTKVCVADAITIVELD